MTEYDPCPNPENIVTHGTARFVLLTDRMLRLEWAEDGAFEDRKTLAVVNRALPPVEHTLKLKGKTLRLETPGFVLRHADDGAPLSADNLSVTFKMEGSDVHWRPGQDDTQNLGATIRTLDGIKGGKREIVKQTRHGKWKATGKWEPVDLGKGFISRAGWSLIDDSQNVTVSGDPEWAAPRQAGTRQDWYLLLHGRDYTGALADAALVFGRQPLPPRYAFGYWWSRYWAYTDQEIESLVGQFDARSVPIDVMVIDMDWHLEGWTGYTWDRRYFPDPAEFLAWLKSRDLKITLNLHPAEGVAKTEEQFPEMAKAMGLDPKSVDRVPFDITDPRYMESYFKILHQPNERAGVDFWWMDWQQGQTSAMPGLDTLPWINQLHWRDMERNPLREGKRPLIFSRFGGYGAGRYCIGFSGDTISVWESLQFQPYFTATASNVLYGYWSHDIGGHMPGAIEPELYTRWIQFGVFAPILRTHTTKNPMAERRVWAYPEPYGDLMVDAIRQRYQMLPYVYTEARRAYDTAISLCRPMYYAYPEVDKAYRVRDQYLFGDKMIVAPVLTPVDEEDEMAEVKVWLPEGDWFDTARGCFEKGGKTIARRYMISETPVFVRPGTILPGQKAPLRIREGSYPQLVVTAVPGGSGEYRLYEDDGMSTAYQSDQCAWIPLSQRETEAGREITIGPAEGSFDGFTPGRSLEIRLPGAVPPVQVKIGKTKLPREHRLEDSGWTYDGQTGTVLIRTPRIDLSSAVTVTIENDPAVAAALADGLKGMMARLERVSYYNTLATSWAISHPQERLGVDAAQAGNRISRDPSTFATEVTRLRGLVKQLRKMLTELGQTPNPGAKEVDPTRAAYCRKALAILKQVK